MDSGYNLPIALIGMITHGHAKGHYGHFMLNGLWPSNPNLKIGSVASCLHNFKRMDKHPLGDLVNKWAFEKQCFTSTCFKFKDSFR